MKCIDNDCSYIDETKLEDDYETHTYKDYVYTDFDSLDIAKATTRTENSPMVGNITAATFFAQPIDGDLGDDITAGEANKVFYKGFVDETTNTRWIPFRAKLATKDGGYIEFRTVNDTKLELDVYKLWYNEDTEQYEWVSQSSLSGSVTGSGKYKIDEKAIYMIGVPLSSTSYSGISGTKLGFNLDAGVASGSTRTNVGENNVDQFNIKLKLFDKTASTVVELHNMIMVRRVIYHDK